MGWGGVCVCFLHVYPSERREKKRERGVGKYRECACVCLPESSVTVKFTGLCRPSPLSLSTTHI